jgi:hypothetical protein
LLIMRSLLGLEPDLACGRLQVAPALPADALPFELRGLRLGSRRIDLSVTRAGATVGGEVDGLEIIDAHRRPAPVAHHR